MSERRGKIVITGCGRSGTTYTSRLFKTFGFSVGHEREEEHGISSWYLASEKSKRKPTLKDVQSRNIPIVHQVRDPIKVISSMSTVSDRSWKLIRECIPIKSNDSLRLKCMKYWYHWNLLAEDKSEFTFQIEKIKDHLPKLFSIAGFDESHLEISKMSKVPTNINKRNHSSLTWENLETEDEQLTEDIRKLATRYGYSF
jgi:hypothetical protein